MTLLNLTVEGYYDNPNATPSQVEQAVRRMPSAAGPTYVIMSAANGCFMQAAGTDGRYVIESRDVFGEGFTHWRAGTRPSATGVKARILFRNKCPEGRHPRRQCPVTIDEADVVEFTDVLKALVWFARTGARHSDFHWRDVSDEFPLSAEDGEIQSIHPCRERGER